MTILLIFSGMFLPFLLGFCIHNLMASLPEHQPSCDKLWGLEYHKLRISLSDLAAIEHRRNEQPHHWDHPPFLGCLVDEFGLYLPIDEACLWRDVP